MAITVTSDLVDVSSCDSLTAGGTWLRSSGTSSGNPAADADAQVHNTACVANKMGGTINTDVGGHFAATGTFDFSGTGKLFYWRQLVTPGNMLTKANQGVTLSFTSDTTSGTAWTVTNWRRFHMDGSDTIPIAPGWVPYMVDLNQSPDSSNGTVNLAAIKSFAFLCRQNSGVTTTVSNQFIDALRIGTGLTLTCSSSADAPNFGSMFSVDNTVTNRWGIITQLAGNYLGQGVITLGATNQTNAVNFSDSGGVFIWRKNICAATWQKFDLKSNSATNYTRMSLTGYVMRGQQQQPWSVVCDTNSRFVTNACSLSDMNSATLSSGSSLVATTISNSGQIDLNGGSISGCSLSNCTATSQVLCSTPSEVAGISDTTFTRGGGTTHAIEIRGTAAAVTLSGVTFSGYAATNGSTGTEAVFVNIASGTVTITVSGGNTPSIRTAGATVNVVSGATVTFTGLPTGCDIVILTAGTSTILNQVDQHGSNSYPWAYQGTPTVDVGFIKPGFVPYYIRGLSLGATDSSIPVAMTADRNYV